MVLGFNAPQAGYVVPNEYVAAHVARYPFGLIGFGSVDPHDRDCILELERMKYDLGLVGCKMGPIFTKMCTHSAASYCECARPYSDWKSPR